MALVNCPECKKEISDNATSCPHCGYSLQTEVSKTELGTVEKNATAGIVYIIVGTIAVVVGFFTLSIIVGFLIIFGGLGLIGLGTANISGMQSGTCPYCKNSLKAKYKDTTVKCNHCKRISRKVDSYLEKII